MSGKLQIKPGQSVAVLNAPPGLVLPGVPAAAIAADADVVVAFVTRRDDLPSAEQAIAAARADRLAWISYPKGGQLGTDLNRDRLAAALSLPRRAARPPGVDRRHLVRFALPPRERVAATPPVLQHGYHASIAPNPARTGTGNTRRPDFVAHRVKFLGVQV